METIEGHGGDVALAALRAAGVEEMFTLSGGHVFPVYDAAARQNVRIVDVRHEQTATFAAEATAKLHPPARAGRADRRPRRDQLGLRGDLGLLHRRPGGRARRAGADVRWGRGGLQELDHVPIMAPVDEAVRAPRRPATRSAGAARRGARAALTPHRGPVFLDVPMDTIFSPAERRHRVRGAGAGRGPTRTRSPRWRRCSPGPSGRRSSSAATSGSAGPRTRCGGRPRRCGCRCS